MLDRILSFHSLKAMDDLTQGDVWIDKKKFCYENYFPMADDLIIMSMTLALDSTRDGLLTLFMIFALLSALRCLL